MKLKPLPAFDYVDAILAYDPVTGSFHRKVDRKRWKAGEITTGAKVNGYIYIGIDTDRYVAHRLAWLLMTGTEPVTEIDHINGARSDNRWENLRLASHSENGRNKGALKNSKTGVKGVYPYKNGFRAKVCVNRKSFEAGVYPTIAEAKEARDKLARAIHGEFFRS
jgi:hypothetical protein